MIPYNSIIDQTVDVFERLFGEKLENLRHQSTFSVEDAEDRDEDYLKRQQKFAAVDMRLFIVTIQYSFLNLFMQTSGESFGNCTIADSTICFDEALFDATGLSSATVFSQLPFITHYLNTKRFFDGNHAGF